MPEGKQQACLIPNLGLEQAAAIRGQGEFSLPPGNVTVA